ncbi:MAG: nucleotidyl transferase AbiEii/AbiGii toxin family protein, partial [Myxococcaceae bacterium]|nr:nucleotidyl transferase AbiEii/AbiGii toxin family protein [Myxococcaceae bacterium]
RAAHARFARVAAASEARPCSALTWGGSVLESAPGSIQESVKGIKADADYEGVRVRFVGLLGKARVTMQIDVGFGDVVTPGAQDISYPALLDFPAPALSGYPRETVIAEKFQAMVYLRTLNSRMKDFYDVWLLARQFAFDGRVLAKAIAATFANHETAIDVEPIAFTPEFTEQSSTLAQWAAFRKKLPNTECPETLAEVVPFLTQFLLPIARACAGGESFEQRWPPSGPWA